ncbi:MAG: SDR family oxidoreductase [Planctomycetes bacterium]|nr:SDR family oxidoreductase [Planctomycetota bacterium]
MDAGESLVVLGGTGFLGAHVVRRAVARRFTRVVSISRTPSVQRALLPAEVEQITLDLTHEDELARALERLAARRVVLCAALARVADCEQDPERASAVNAGVPRHVARTCARLGARLVHVSTDLVFGRCPPPRPSGFDEGDEPGPLSVYGESKWLGERLVLAQGAEVLVARLPLLFGDSLGRGLGASDSLLASVARGEHPSLFRDEWRTPLDVVDAADALLELVLRREVGVMHLAGPERVDRVSLGLAALIASGVDSREAPAKFASATRADLGLARQRPADVALDASRARSLLATRLRGVREALRSG